MALHLIQDLEFEMWVKESPHWGQHVQITGFRLSATCCFLIGIILNFT